jgi:hypothetical protein
MHKITLISLCLLSSLGKPQEATASHLMTGIEEKKDIIFRACLYQYSDNPEAKTDDVDLEPSSTFEQIQETFSRSGGVHVNLIDMAINDDMLQDLLPFVPSIYGLSLADNQLTKECLPVIQHFAELRMLDLANNSLVSSTDFDFLAKLPHLIHVDLRHNKIDPREIARIRKLLPRSDILVD